MAGAKPGVHALQLKPMVVHEDLKKGGKFIKWEEDVNITPCLVTLKVDPEGFFVYWNSLSTQEVEVLDICMIRDTRLGKYAKQPKDPKVQKLLDYTEEKELFLLTIVYGTDLVNISFLNILALQEDTAKLWADELFSLATNLLSHNASRTTYLLKVYSKLKIQVMKDGKIPVKNFHKMFSDKKRVETALEQCNLVRNKSDGIKPEDFTWEAFQKFLNSLCLRSELQTIFEDCGSKKKLFISLDQFMNFLNQKQRDPRLNEVLFPPLKREQVRQIMEKYEANISQLDRDQISLQAFSQYLAGEENGIVPPERFDVIEEDMKQPLSHYFINSSHNTYLTVGQLTGLSSVEMYRQVLLTGCRCIELDCWKGRPPDEEPNITHGFTMTTEISFKEVIEAIAESAFKTSSYPVILSFENHVDSPRQQAKMAEYCRNIFKDALLVDPLEKYPLIPGQPLPSPMDLLGKILIKNKKRHHHHDLHEHVGSVRRRGTEEQLSPLKDDTLKKSEENQVMSNGEEHLEEQITRESGPRKSIGGEGESEEEEEEEQALNSKKPNTDEGTASSEAKATEEMSTLVNYIEPVKFKSFELATKRRLFFEMSSFVETKGMDILKNSPMEFVDYNKNQLSRIYPKGTRVDSSNYNPQLFWNVGCQMVALNFQTLDLPMQLNMGVFEYNGSSGYLLKPEVMRRMDKQFDPFTENTVDGIVANTLSIKVISGQFLSDRKVGVYVEVDIFGLPADTKRKYRTKTSQGNSLDPVWDDETFIFAKVILPTLASLRIAVFEESGKFVGHRILPVSAIRPGYRYINLKNDLNQPLMLPSLLVYTEVQDYIPNEHLDYADALADPIKHQSAKREEQLAGLLEIEHVTSQPKERNLSKETEVITVDRVSFPAQMFLCAPEESPDIIKPPAPVQTPRENLVATVMSEFKVVPLEELMKHKVYEKLVKKQSKDLKELQKKNLKKLQSENQKKCSVIEKNFKRSIKKNEPKEPVQERDMQELLKLGVELFSSEKEMQKNHLTESFKKLKELTDECQAAQMKKVKEMCDKEKREIQKILDRKRQNSITEAKTKEKEKAETELSEINKKHIQDSVTAIRKLEEEQVKRHESLKLKHQEVLQHIDEKFVQQHTELELKLGEDYQKLIQKICQQFHSELQNKGLPKEGLPSSLFNHSSPGSSPPSSCSTPHFQSASHRSRNKSMDEGIASLADSSSSSSTTPVRSEGEFLLSKARSFDGRK